MVVWTPKLSQQLSKKLPDNQHHWNNNNTGTFKEPRFSQKELSPPNKGTSLWEGIESHDPAGDSHATSGRGSRGDLVPRRIVWFLCQKGHKPKPCWVQNRKLSTWFWKRFFHIFSFTGDFSFGVPLGGFSSCSLGYIRGFDRKNWRSIFLRKLFFSRLRLDVH